MQLIAWVPMSDWLQIKLDVLSLNRLTLIGKKALMNLKVVQLHASVEEDSVWLVMLFGARLLALMDGISLLMRMKVLLMLLRGLF